MGWFQCTRFERIEHTETLHTLYAVDAQTFASYSSTELELFTVGIYLP